MGRKLFVLAALLLLLLPLALTPFGVDIRAYRTDAQTAVFTENPAGYVTDRLALRTAAITLRAKALALLGESGSPQVIRGRDGFLFFAESLYTEPLTDQELAALTDKLTALEQALAADGRRLIILIAPDKASVYPEMLPLHVLPRQPDPLQQANASLRDAGLTVLDAQGLLTAHKGEGLLYFRGDSHWNTRGARIICQELMRLTGTEAPDHADAPLLPGTAGDLTLLCQPGTPPTEPDASPDIPRAYRTARPMRTADDARIQTTSTTTSLSLLVVRDSFGRGLLPYLANTAGRMTFSRSDQDVPAQAAAAKADWVVIEVAQRNLRSWLQDDVLYQER